MDIKRACLEGCTDPQKEAIRHRDGPLLVLAGPGSGKTRVITRRIAYLIGDGVPARNILAITFTNKAAGEMSERVVALGTPPGAWISTFHSFCARMLRSFASRLGLTSNFTIYDTADSLAAIKRATRETAVNLEDSTPGAIAQFISNAKNRLEGPEDVSVSLRPETLKVARIYSAYQRILKSNNAVDFDDLLLLMVRLLKEHADVLSRLQQRFTHILMDEYQDTNHAQYLIARYLASAHRNICATGDPDQSIYGWRGANLSNILEFEKEYPDAAVVRLEQNYRSTKRILRAASTLIEHNVARKEKALWTDNDEGERINLLRCEDEGDEARRIAQDIVRRIARREVSPRDVAVFYRTNAQSRVLETALRGMQLPHEVVQGTAYYQRTEIKDILAYLRLLVNPADDVSLERVINRPLRRIGNTSLRRLREWANRESVSLFDALARPQEAGVKGPALTGIGEFRKLIESLNRLPKTPVAPIVEEVISVTEFERYLRTLDNSADRIENVRELISAAVEYDRAEPEGDLSGFLESVVLAADTDRWDPSDGAVTLMTLHAAKGLEFPAVYVTGLEDGMLPLMVDDDNCDLEEERRLLFVGITRAMRHLTLSVAETRMRFGVRHFTTPSRFLEELPEDVVSGGLPDMFLQTTPGKTRKPLRRREATVRRVKRSETEEIVYDGEEPLDEHPYRKGDWVQHPSYGRGCVVGLSGFGESLKVRVRFQSVGFKVLVPEYANLRKVGREGGA